MHRVHELALCHDGTHQGHSFHSPLLRLTRRPLSDDLHAARFGWCARILGSLILKTSVSELLCLVRSGIVPDERRFDYSRMSTLP